MVRSTQSFWITPWPRGWAPVAMVAWPGEVIVEFNKDLISQTITPQLVTSLLAAVNAGAISRQSFIDALRKGEVIDNTTEDELDLIDDEGGGLDDTLIRFPTEA